MKKTIISILLLACLALGLCSCAGGEKMKNGIKEFGDGAKDALDDVFTAEAPLEVTLCAAAATVVETEEGSVLSQTVTGAVSGTDAAVLLDWTVTWGVNPYGEEVPVTDYVTVVPESDGALVADIICHQAIDRTATAIVTATVRGKDKSASCTVRYNGIPSDIVFTDEDGTALENGLTLALGDSIALNVTLDNLFHDVGADYSDFEIETEISGTVTGEASNNGASTVSTGTIAPAAIVDQGGRYQIAELFSYNGGSVTLEDGVLSIKLPFGGKYFTSPDGTRYTIVNFSKLASMKIYVKELQSGLTEMFTIIFDATNVTLSDTTVTF
ncbi:MAG: hypothetical protein IJC29_03800 [Clostridia bacterium]|nr:hypothetical protein [Clostridia bacterium]